MDIEARVTVKPDDISMSDGNVYIMVRFFIERNEKKHSLGEELIQWGAEDTEEDVLGKINKLRAEYAERGNEVVGRLAMNEDAKSAARGFAEKYQTRVIPKKEEVRKDD